MAILVIAAVGVYTGVIDVQKLFGHENNADDHGNVTGDIQVHFIDVGQDDSILIQFPNGENVLIDAGGTCGSDVLISYFHSCFVETINRFFITHPHTDHINYADDAWKISMLKSW